ncbi:helix-turn-helix domain-containing protein [Azorhizobium doebereinerae]|uniref:helix-turn-helix domain-containing protein n=1 Tax=Azorhizobium doebereinerae TaxID=281091 RepID=UPI0003F6CE5A|nr:helix-turn-helix domain-containing protein [Azorhizobium doebereinerae]
MIKTRNPRDWHPEDIKAAIRKKGLTLSAVSRGAGLIDDACRHACSRPHYFGELAIAAALNIPARQIWPSRFDAKGGRKHQHRTRRKPNAAQPCGQRQNAEAA